MKPVLPSEVVSFGKAAAAAIGAAGGIELARRAVVDTSVRTTDIAPVLQSLGIDDIDAAADLETLLAACELTRVCGSFAVPYPVGQRLAASVAECDESFLAVVDRVLAVEHGDLPGGWLVVEPAGATWLPIASGDDRRYVSIPYVHHVDRGERRAPATGGQVALGLVLQSWELLGAAQSAHAWAASHVVERHQFGRRLADFQLVQGRVADSEVAVRGLRQLAQFTSWRWSTSPAHALVDAWALRTQAIETVRVVLAHSHVLHGAVGFCDEHDLSILDMKTQAAVRLPADLERSTEILGLLIRDHGFSSPFSDPTCPPVEERRRTRKVAP